MALTPATITLNFTSHYDGGTRACYRLNGTGAYTCVTTTCGEDTSCQAIITIMVDNETCVPVTIDGYIQAECEDLSSTTGRVTFEQTFTPEPTCLRYEVTCTSVALVGATMTNVGFGYTQQAPPAVTIAGGGGTATGVVVIGTGSLAPGTYTITNYGAGYIPGTYVGVSLIGAGGGVVADIVINALGNMQSLTVTSVGFGLITGNILTPAGGSGTPAIVTGSTPIAITISASNYSVITGVTITSSDALFTSLPTITIAAPLAPIAGATQATATPVMGPCDEFLAPACGTPSDIYIPGDVLYLGDVVDICQKGRVPVVPDGYTIAANRNCVCGCQVATITAVSGVDQSSFVQYWYTACNGALVSGLLTPFGSSMYSTTITPCVVVGSVLIKSISGGVGSIAYGDPC